MKKEIFFAVEEEEQRRKKEKGKENIWRRKKMLRKGRVEGSLSGPRRPKQNVIRNRLLLMPQPQKDDF